MRAPALIVALAAAPAAAISPGQSDFVFSSDLMAGGAVPFAVSSTGNALYGLRRGSDLFLCFLADTSDAQASRQQALLDAIMNGADPVPVPNIPVICVLTQ